MSTLPTPAHFIFVDFENVPNVDLEGLNGRPVHATLLIGKNQRKVDLDLALQLRTFASQVTPVLVGASGRNALDLTLACHLGRAIERNPGAHFAIVSKDRDFDAMITHLNANGVKVARFDSLADLPWSDSSKPKPSQRGVTTPKSVTEKKTPDDRSARILARLKNPASRNRPGDETALRAYLKTGLGKGGTEASIDALVHTLVREQALTIDGEGAVTYRAG